MATALVEGDEDLQRRVKLHRERRPRGWGTLEIGDLDEVLNAAKRWDAVLLDSLTLWVSARRSKRSPNSTGSLPQLGISACRFFW